MSGTENIIEIYSMVSQHNVSMSIESLSITTYITIWYVVKIVTTHVHVII